jgi:hypothetical protein
VSGQRGLVGCLALERLLDLLFLARELLAELVGQGVASVRKQSQTDASTLERLLEIRRRTGAPFDSQSIPRGDAQETDHGPRQPRALALGTCWRSRISPSQP